MCYDVSFLTRKAEKYAQHYGTEEQWKSIIKSLSPTHHVSGFDQPRIPAITNDHGVTHLQWSFIPMEFSKRNTLNARDDRIFTKESVYNESARQSRCIVMLDGFFDHHKKKGVAYPYYIELKSSEPMMVAGLWQTYKTTAEELDCVTLVTTRANKEMAWIHNEPAHSPASRMVFILQDKFSADLWLNGTEEEAKDIIWPMPDDSLKYHACKPIKPNKKLNRTYMGNVPGIKEKTYYTDLEEEQGSLF